MIVKEDRESTRNQGQYIDRIATQGTSSLALVFHPDYMKNFRMTCEGLGKWHGQPAWQIRFEQRPDAHYISGIVMDGRVYAVKLRGRGWILADSYQVAHLEMDIAEAIPKIRLRLEHIAVDYVPVVFPNNGETIWLPSNAELYVDFRGHRFYRRHTYINFRLFSVKVDQQFGGLE